MSQNTSITFQNIKKHINSCKKNPNVNQTLNKRFKKYKMTKVNCSHCNGIFVTNIIERHMVACKKNPNRIYNHDSAFYRDLVEMRKYGILDHKEVQKEKDRLKKIVPA